jgi:hypothetical protein
VIARALAKNPAERFQRGKQFADELRRLREKRPPRKSTIWFSPPAPGRGWLDGKAAAEGSAASNAARNSITPLHAAPRKNSSLSAMLSSWQVQTAIGVPLFAAAMVVTLFAWREIHEQRVPAKNAAAIADETRTAASAPNVLKVPTPAVAADSANQPPSQAHAGGSQEAAVENESPMTATQSAAKTKAVHSSASTPSTGTRKASATGLAKSGAPPATKTARLVPSKTMSNAGMNLGTGKQADQASGPTVAPASTVADSNVEIRIENRFSDATMKVWIDDNLAYSHPLHDGHKKRLMLLGGGAKEAITIPISAGKHALRIEVRSAAEQYDETKTVESDFLSGGERILAISFDKHSRDMRLALGNE